MFEEYTQLSIVKTKNSMISPMQFARAPRPTFYYSEDHFTEKLIMHLIQNPNLDNYHVEKTNFIES